jgi:hypothetical protein
LPPFSTGNALDEALSHPLGDRLWILSKIFNCSPFTPDLLSLTMPQTDWILAKYAAENPDKLKIERVDGTRVGEPDGKAWVRVHAAWGRVLRGSALAEQEGIEKLRPVLDAIARMRAEGRLEHAAVGALQARAVDARPPAPVVKSENASD